MQLPATFAASVDNAPAPKPAAQLACSDLICSNYMEQHFVVYISIGPHFPAVPCILSFDADMSMYSALFVDKLFFIFPSCSCLINTTRGHAPQFKAGLALVCIARLQAR